jgi:hypothetical protein
MHTYIVGTYKVVIFMTFSLAVIVIFSVCITC